MYKLEISLLSSVEPLQGTSQSSKCHGQDILFSDILNSLIASINSFFIWHAFRFSFKIFLYQIITLIKYYANPYKGKPIKLFKNGNTVKCFKYYCLSSLMFQAKLLISFKFLCFNQLERKNSNFQLYDHIGLRKFQYFQMSEVYNSVIDKIILVPCHIRS